MATSNPDPAQTKISGITRITKNSTDSPGNDSPSDDVEAGVVVTSNPAVPVPGGAFTIAVFASDKSDADADAAFYSSNIHLSIQLSNLTDDCLKKLETEQKFELVDQYASSIITKITEMKGAFYKYESNQWSKMDDNDNAIMSHVKIPLTALQKNKWKDYIEKNRDISMWTLYHYHPIPTGTSKSLFIFFKFLLLLTYIIQLLVPIFVIFTARNTFQDTFKSKICQGEASLINKLIAFAIAIIYFMVLAMQGMQNHKVITGKSPLNETNNGGKLQNAVITDRLFRILYGPLMKILNLLFVFLEKESYTLITNAFALQFIFELSNEAKAMFISTFPLLNENYQMYIGFNQGGDQEGKIDNHGIQDKPWISPFVKRLTFFSVLFPHYWHLAV